MFITPKDGVTVTQNVAFGHSPHNLLLACFGKLAATHFLATVGPETNLSGAALVERNTERRTKIVHEITTGAR